MKYVFAAVEAAIAVVLALTLLDFATGAVAQPDTFQNVVGLVGGVLGAATLVYVATKRVEYYSR